MILTDKLIKKAIEDGSIKIEPFSEEHLQPASYDLTVGNQAILTSTESIVNVKEKGFFELGPGDFGLVLIAEALKFDTSHVARIGLRSYYARKGIIATTGAQIDPGFEGRLKIGVANLTPKTISFPYADHLLTIEIHKLSEPSKNPYKGPYQGHTELSPDDIRAVKEREAMSLTKMQESLLSLSKNVGEFAKEVREMTQKQDGFEKEMRGIAEQQKVTQSGISWLKWVFGICFGSVVALLILLLGRTL